MNKKKLNTGIISTTTKKLKLVSPLPYIYLNSRMLLFRYIICKFSKCVWSRWKRFVNIPPVNWIGYAKIMSSNAIKYANSALIKFCVYAKVTNINSRHWIKFLRIYPVSILKIVVVVVKKTMPKVMFSPQITRQK